MSELILAKHKAQRFRNSIIIYLPKSWVDSLGIDKGTPIEMRVKEDDFKTLILKPVREEDEAQKVARGDQ